MLGLWQALGGSERGVSPQGALPGDKSQPALLCAQCPTQALLVPPTASCHGQSSTGCSCCCHRHTQPPEQPRGSAASPPAPPAPQGWGWAVLPHHCPGWFGVSPRDVSLVPVGSVCSWLCSVLLAEFCAPSCVLCPWLCSVPPEGQECQAGMMCLCVLSISCSVPAPPCPSSAPSQHKPQLHTLKTPIYFIIYLFHPLPLATGCSLLSNCCKLKFRNKYPGAQALPHLCQGHKLLWARVKGS